MKNIREHIKSEQFASYYLLYGRDGYLKNLYRDKLVDALCGGRESMNFSRYEGEATDVQEVAELAKTPPFLEERRVLLLENTGLFRNANQLTEMLSQRAESSFLIFVEDTVDKRNALFRLVKEQGYVTELNGLEERELKLFVAGRLKQAGLLVAESTVLYFLDMCGSDLLTLSNELEKLSAYCMGNEQVRKEDIDEICVPATEGRIFWMLDAMFEKNSAKVWKLYADLLALHEKPMHILYLLNKSFLQFSQVTALLESGVSAQDAAKLLAVAPFVVTKYQRLQKGFSGSRAEQALLYGTMLEQKVKTGDLEESAAVELFLTRYSE